MWLPCHFHEKWLPTTVRRRSEIRCIMTAQGAKGEEDFNSRASWHHIHNRIWYWAGRKGFHTRDKTWPLWPLRPSWWWPTPRSCPPHLWQPLRPHCCSTRYCVWCSCKSPSGREPCRFGDWWSRCCRFRRRALHSLKSNNHTHIWFFEWTNWSSFSS